MFVEIVFASLIAAGGADALAQTPQPEHAVMQDAGAGQAAPRVQLAADLGCPRHYHRRHAYDNRCYRNHAEPYYGGERDSYGGHGDRYHRQDYGHYRGHGAPHHGEEPHRGRGYEPRDSLHDRYGRPYPETGPGYEEDAPPYRHGGYDEPAPHERGYDEPGHYDGPERRSGEGFRHYRESDAPRPYYHRSNYREPGRKKKATDLMTATADRSRTAASAAGSTA